MRHPPCACAGLRNSKCRVRRTLVIGDVHGCVDELAQLLDEAAITSNDAVIFVGDLVGRGPDSVGVLDCALELNADSVQGNHERQLLQLMDTGTSSVPPTVQRSRLQLIQSLEPRHVQWLRTRPLYLELTAHEACVVHAGVVPGVPWPAQDPWVLTHLRSFDAHGRPSAALGDAPWAAGYEGPVHIVFGHSAQRGLQLHAFATGLDSGCVYGGSLTGLLLNENEPVPAVAERHASVVSVAARRAYCKPHG